MDDSSSCIYITPRMELWLGHINYRQAPDPELGDSNINTIMAY